jgi:glycosyltransferase involved in cell wall biosynthesis
VRPETRISIALAVYNGERFISEQLESFVYETRLPDELVVTDNCSTDRTAEIVQDFAAHAPFPVRFYVNNENAGVGKNFDRAISECTGDIIFLSDGDDIWYPDKLRLMEQALEKSPEADLVACEADVVDEDLQPCGYTTSSLRRFQRPPFSDLPPSFLGNSLAFRARLKSVILPIPSSSIFLKGHHDTWLGLVTLAWGGGVLSIPRPLQAWRQHRTQQSGGFPRPPKAKLVRGSELLDEPLAVMLAELEARIESPDQKMRSVDRRVLQELREFVTHLKTRARLPASRPRRLPIVIKELAGHRYSRYSSGVLSAIKDLVL